MGQRHGKMKDSDGTGRSGTFSECAVRSMSAGALRGRKTRGGRKRSSLPTAGDDEVTDLPMFLTREQKTLIRHSFECIKQIVGDVGVVFFMRLFETHPEVQSSFPPFNGQSQEDLKHSNQLRNHGLRVMGFVEKCVSRLDQPEKLVALCLDLGLRHQTYRVPVSYLPLIPPQFIYAIKPALKERWNQETEVAWLVLFNILLFYMREAMNKPLPAGHATTPSSPASRKDSA